MIRTCRIACYVKEKVVIKSHAINTPSTIPRYTDKNIPHALVQHPTTTQNTDLKSIIHPHLL